MPKRPPDVLHCRTPTLIAIDNRGSAIRSIVYHRSQAAEPLDERISRTTYMALGAVDTQTDARFFTEHANAANAPNNFCYGRSLSGKVVHTASVDAGETETLFDIEGRRCWSADSRDTVMRHDYDPLGRPTTVTEQHKEQVAVTERLIYADTASASSHQNLAVSDGHNGLGQLIYHLDPAGVLKTDSFSLSGTPLAQTRQLLADDDVQVNWPAFNRFTELSDIAPIYYRTQWQLDASGTTIAQWDANGNRQRLLYNVSGQLRSSHLQQAEQLSEQMIVSNFEYTAAGQVLEETAGNGVKTVYTFEPETQRLLSIYSRRSSKNGRPTVLQDLHYVYDPVGNILSIGDRAQQTQYFAKQKTSAQRDYSYDTLYQLIKASGREDANAGKQTQALPPLKTPLPEAADGQLSAYTRDYQYDRGGNLIQIRHTGAHAYTRTIEIANNSNRAAFVRIGADGGSLDKEAQSFDGRGNLLVLSSGQRLSWNLRNQLIQATVIDRAHGAPNDEEHYRYGSDGMRVSKTTQKKSGLQSDKVIYLPGLELRTQNNGKEVLDVILIGEAGRCQVRALHWKEGKPEQIENDQLRYSVDDQIGSSVLELDSNADKLSEEVYYPYGGTACWAAKSKVEAKYKYVRYSGKERDETGLYYYGYRYYMPWLGRWLNPDPAGTVDGLNLFRMVRGNPVDLIDDDGLAPVIKGLDYFLETQENSSVRRRELAQQAVLYTQRSLPNKSPNKHYGFDNSLVPAEKLGLYNYNEVIFKELLLANYRGKDNYKYKQYYDLHQRQNYINSILQAGTGNCDEHSMISAEYLRHNVNVSEDYVLRAGFREEERAHSLTILGPSPKSFGGYYADNFGLGGERDITYEVNAQHWIDLTEVRNQSVVVDSWANIVTPLSSYEHVWASQMQRWQARGLRIADNDQPENWISAPWSGIGVSNVVETGNNLTEAKSRDFLDSLVRTYLL